MSSGSTGVDPPPAALPVPAVGALPAAPAPGFAPAVPAGAPAVPAVAPAAFPLPAAPGAAPALPGEVPAVPGEVPAVPFPEPATEPPPAAPGRGVVVALSEPQAPNASKRPKLESEMRP